MFFYNYLEYYFTNMDKLRVEGYLDTSFINQMGINVHGSYVGNDITTFNIHDFRGITLGISKLEFNRVLQSSSRLRLNLVYTESKGIKVEYFIHADTVILASAA